jgi:hypothetical protein
MALLLLNQRLLLDQAGQNKGKFCCKNKARCVNKDIIFHPNQ